MINDIVSFHNLWNAQKHTIPKRVVVTANDCMLHECVYRINQEEGVGTQDWASTMELLQGTNKECYSISEQETKNIKKAFLHLQTIRSQWEEDTRGFLEVEECLVKTHKVLMTGVMSPGKTAPGKFSSGPRIAHCNNKVHHYPIKSNQEWQNTLTTLVDRHNALVASIQLEPVRNRVVSLYKLAAWFLFELICYHPFADGNGRLCRLLASHILSAHAPFATPIYNIFSQIAGETFLEAIVSCRENSDGTHFPMDLTSLIIESSWLTWQKYLQRLGICNTGKAPPGQLSTIDYGYY